MDRLAADCSVTGDQIPHRLIVHRHCPVGGSAMVASSGCVRRAFTLEGRGIWHAASISLAQQVWGPLRARLDTRLALDMTSQVIQPLPPNDGLL